MKTAVEILTKNRYDTEGKERAEMDELRMIVSCIEYYSYAKNIPGNKVFEAFDKNGVIQLLQDTRNRKWIPLFTSA